MTHLPLLTAALALGATMLVSSVDSPAAARRRAIPFALLLVLGNLGGALFGTVPHDAVGVVAAFDPMAAALAVVLASLVAALVLGDPNENVDAAYYGRLLATGAIGTAFLLLREPMLVAFAWPLTAAPALAELAARESAAHRVARFHVVVSAIAVLAGTVGVLAGGPVAIAAGLILLGVVAREGIFPAHGMVERAHRTAPFGVALLLTQPQLGLHLLDQVGTETLAQFRIPLLVASVATVAWASWHGRNAQTGRELMVSATLAFTAVSLGAAVLAPTPSEAAVLALVVGSSLGALALALSIADRRGGMSATFSTATLTLGLVAFVVPTGLVLVDAARAEWAWDRTLLAAAAAVGASVLALPLARIAAPDQVREDARVSWAEALSLTGLAATTVVLTLHAERMTAWLAR